MSTPTADIGLIGLAVMGENLVLNIESRGYTVAVFNRTTSVVDKFVAGRAAGKKIIGTQSLKDLVANLKRPRKVMIMVKAGAAVDAVIAEVAPLLEPGDILIDGGNTHFPDTTRRVREANAKGLLYIGTGVSGGEEGALKGPSIMPGGDEKAWPAVKPIFQAIAAKVDGDVPCCEYRGTGSRELGDEVAAKLADRGAALLANHGLVTCASTPEKALHNAALVERTAKIIWGARAMGATIHPLPEKVNRNMAGVYTFIRENPGPASTRRGRPR